MPWFRIVGCLSHYRTHTQLWSLGIEKASDLILHLTHTHRWRMFLGVGTDQWLVIKAIHLFCDRQGSESLRMKGCVIGCLNPHSGKAQSGVKVGCDTSEWQTQFGWQAACASFLVSQNVMPQICLYGRKLTA